MSSIRQPQYISLKDWARRTFEVAPPKHTLVRLAASGAIQPAPFVLGRAYYVVPEAVFVQPAPPALDDGQPTALYRHYDAAGKLLYVGISLHALIRLSAHARDADWYRQIAIITVQHLPSRAAAMAAEAKAILEEAPIHNVAGKPAWKLAGKP